MKNKKTGHRDAPLFSKCKTTPTLPSTKLYDNLLFKISFDFILFSNPPEEEKELKLDFIFYVIET